MTRRAERVDATQAEIVKALRKIGARPMFIDYPVDLLVGFRGQNFLLECKSERPTSEGGSHKLTQDQQNFIASWPGQWALVRSPEDAITALLGKDAMR